MDQLLTSFVTAVGQEKDYVFLICSKEKHLHFQEKVRKSIRQMCMTPNHQPSAGAFSVKWGYLYVITKQLLSNDMVKNIKAIFT